MGLYLKFLGILIMLSGLLLGGLTFYAPQDDQSFEQRLAQINKKYEKIGKELDGLISKNLEGFILSRGEKFKKVKGISLIIGGIIFGSLFLGLGEAVSLLKKIFRQ